MTIEEIKELLRNRNYKKLLKSKNINIIDYVSFAESEEEAIFCIQNDIETAPICTYPDCQDRKAFRISGKHRYSEGCSYNHTSRILNLEKYGVENVSQLKVVKDKKEKTTLRNYGVKNPKQNKEIATKIKETMVSKYGGFGTSGILKDKINGTCFERYGVINPMQSKQHQDSLVKTLFEKIVLRLENYVIPNFTFAEYLGSEARQEWTCKKCDTIFPGKIDNGGIPRCPTCYPNQKKSYGEIDLFNAIQYINKIQGDWSVLGKKELDIYIPDKKLAIEFNGIYWHSELNGKDKNYHLNKTIQCNEKGIQLIHVFETEFYEKPKIIESIIHAKLGQFEKRIYARNTVVQTIKSKDKNRFLEENHLQGKDSSSVKLGLFYNGELVSVMTFGHSRYNKNYQYEMHRFANKINHQIIGGASKLWKYFLMNYSPESVITYADRRYSDGTFYEKIGFEKITVSPPSHWYFGKGIKGLDNRLGWQKHKQNDRLEVFDPNLTAWENMQINGYDRIWDCGNYVFEWKSKIL